MTLVARDIVDAQHWSGPVMGFHFLVNSRHLLKEKARGRISRKDATSELFIG